MTRACFTGLKHMTMNHTINVSIAGVAFVLDSEGYELLKDYLVRIEVAYKDDPDGAEILSDIEARDVYKRQERGSTGRRFSGPKYPHGSRFPCR